MRHRIPRTGEFPCLCSIWRKNLDRMRALEKKLKEKASRVPLKKPARKRARKRKSEKGPNFLRKDFQGWGVSGIKGITKSFSSMGIFCSTELMRMVKLPLVRVSVHW